MAPQDTVMNDKTFAYETHVLYAYIGICYVILISVQSLRSTNRYNTVIAVRSIVYCWHLGPLYLQSNTRPYIAYYIHIDLDFVVKAATA